MDFDLKTPCKNCPFRTDIAPYITKERAEEIDLAISEQDATFSCHKHLPRDGKKEQHCAGALLYLESQGEYGNPNQLMRISERIGQYDRRLLDFNAPVFNNRKDFVNHFKSRDAS